MRGYYLDFVWIDCRLIVEVNGASHEARIDWDRRRDAALAAEGYRTLRFDNASVRDELDGVMGAILSALQAAVPTRPLRGHPPRGGEGEG